MRTSRGHTLVLLVVLGLVFVAAPDRLQAASPPSPATPAALSFLPDGAHIAGLTMRLAALGRGETLSALAPVSPINDGPRVLYVHDDATEWYLRQGDGVEQGVTLAAPPAGAGPLTLTLATPEAIPLVDADGMGATLILPHGGQWRYDGLRVTDATGQVLAAHLTQGAGGIRIVVEDAGAVYPVTVDPFVNRETLAASGTTYFGFAVALSADGSTALVGAYGTNNFAGTAYVFTRGAGGYTLGATLSVSGSSDFGIVVALSADGSTALVGASGTSGAGTAYVFTRGAGGYTQFGATLAVSGSGLFGSAVALSGDGSTALVGAYGTNSFVGTAYVFTRGAGGYTLGPTLAVSGTSLFGIAVALSADGSTALVGAYGTNSGAGTAYVFTRGAGGYTQFGPTLAVSDTGHFGYAVALSADGGTALVGAPNTGAGTAYLFAAPTTLTPVHATTPQHSAVSSPFATPLAVTVHDSFGALAPGVGVTFSTPAGGASGSFACPMGGCPTGTSVSGDGLSATVTSDANGVATAPTFTAGSVAGSYDVTASVSDGIASTSLTPAIFSLTNTAGAAAKIAIDGGDYQSGAIGSAFAAPLVVLVRDTDNNLVSGATVTFTAPSGSTMPSATFAGGGTATTNASGLASISATAAGRPGTATITASVNGVSTSFTLTDTASATTLTLTGFSPASGPLSGGTTVTLHGTNFVSPATVTFGGIAATNVQVVSSTTITAVTPAATSAGTVDISVTTGGQTATMHGYTYLLASGGINPQPGGHALPGSVVVAPMAQPQRHDDPGQPGGGSGGPAPNTAVLPSATPSAQPGRH